MHSTRNDGKSAVAERLIRTLKNKLYKYMTSMSKNKYIDKLADIVNQYKAIHRYCFSIENNDKNPKFKFGDYVRISKHNKNSRNWSQEVFMITVPKVKNTVPRTYVIRDLNGEHIAGIFYEKRQVKQSLG